ncbi:SMR domain-containing protein At5g58720-like [Rutidosis leptorrhynchoides]|uniref:SMR domain-containing protein At5g58720-like n=1 Tax=Rutidosis leptorrhynchoides TaxID=125765 RepID=UPI003A99218C
MKNHKKKKKHHNRSSSNASKPPNNEPPRSNNNLSEDEQQKNQKEVVISSLVEAFGSSVSVEDATSAINDAHGDAGKAVEILENMVAIINKRNANCDFDDGDDPSSTTSTTSAVDWGSGTGSTSWTSSSCGSSEDQNTVKMSGLKQKKRVVATTGSVSTMLGKDYVRKETPKYPPKFKEKIGDAVDKEEAEQFLSSMLGDDSEISMAIVRDVLYQCGYDVDKALDILLDLSSSSNEQSDSENGRCFINPANYKEDMRNLILHGDYKPKAGKSSNLCDGDLQDSIWSIDSGFRSYSKVLTSSETQYPTSPRVTESDIPYKVLDYLFNISRCPEYKPNTMNWRKVVKQMESLGRPMNFDSSSVAETQPVTGGKVDEYHLYRKPAEKQWNTVKSYYKKAATAYSNGQPAYAAYLSDKGKLQTKYAQEAEEKASCDIFKARNKSIENAITIDLHGQHVKHAMKMLKRHLLLVSFVSSIQILRVITGCGSRGLGKSVLKQSVIKLLERESIEWCEENQGTVLIKLDGYRELSFLDSESDIDE